MTLIRNLAFTAALLGSAVFAAQALAQDATPPADAPAAAAPEVPGDAGATPMTDKATFEAFHGEAGIARIASDLVDFNVADPRMDDVFKGIDLPKLKKHLTQQFCYVLGGGCVYTGRTMAASHKDYGINMAEMNALVENLERAMDKEGVPYRYQTKLLAKLAPMKKDVVTR